MKGARCALFYVLDIDSRAGAQRAAVRADAVPARRRADARVRHHGHDQPGARLALHARRLPRLELRADDGLVHRRGAARDPGHRGPRDDSGNFGIENPLCARPSLPGAGNLRADPDHQRGDAPGLGSDAALPMPVALSGPVELLPGLRYPAYRLVIIGVGALVALLLFVLVTRTKVGMLVRAGASNREMALAMGVNIKLLFTIVFGVGGALCAVAGAMLAPLFAVQVGMGENILILAFVVIVIGGIGSIRGALVGAVLVGVVDTIGRAFLPILFGMFFQPRVASAAGPAIASVMIYLLMAVVLFFRPQGLFPARG